LKSVVAAYRGKKVHEDDVVHGDFLATQLLVRGSRLSGVVDWDAAGRGDRCQDLALLFYNAFAQADRHKHPVNQSVISELAAYSTALCGVDRFSWFIAHEILVTQAFVVEHNSRHLLWRTNLGRRVIEWYMQAAPGHG
jgi:aminoglycoside phosphotransferase (APT) family kinase protein